ncbi:MAG: type II toxin-antitoxin system RelE/ParE family toxin [Candidatus Hydrogenedentes bacterium]|nr:type II toxin-antitoxin system RelE/ParE family toxin [Candidatus Hydrogenedentota bacterium]
MVQLEAIIYVKPVWEIEHRIRALSISGKCRVLHDLSTYEKACPSDFKKLLRVMEAAATNRRVHNPIHVKQSAKHPGIYEMRGGQLRLYFFYAPDTGEAVICTNLFLKSHKKLQNASMDKAAELRDLYFTSRGHLSKGN